MSEKCKKTRSMHVLQNIPNRTAKSSSTQRIRFNILHRSKKSEYTRKKVAKALGGDKVPVNMMPNGMPLNGTNRAAWPKEITALL
jgi:hypothetical protein